MLSINKSDISYLKISRAFGSFRSTQEPSELPNLTKVKSHGNNVRDVIIVPGPNRPTDQQTDAENIK